MNLIDIEDRLKDLSDQQLMQQMQRPDGMAPQFLVMSELKRRKEMRGRAPTQPDNSTVKDDLLGQGIASAMPQQPMPQQAMPQQPMPQDGIPRFNNGFVVRPSLSTYGQRLGDVKRRIGDAMRGPSTLPQIFDRSSKGMTVEDVRRSLAGDPMFGDDESAGAPPPTSREIFNPTGANSYAVKPRNLIQRQYAPGTLPPSRLGDVTPTPENLVPGYAENDIGLATKKAFADGSQMYAGDFVAIDPARGGDYPNFGVDAPPAATSTNTDKQISPPGEIIKPEYYTSGLTTVPKAQSAETRNGGMSYADEIAKIYNSAPSATSDVPAAPAQNYYEGIEKKLAALQAAETGPDAGMALLRAGLGMAQAGGEGKSTAAAIGAGGIAGLDAYEAQKKASDARAMQLLGVESELAGAKTKQSYDQQSLALQARQRDIAEKGLKLNALGQLNDNETRRYIADRTNAIQQQRVALEQQTIGIKNRSLDETIRHNKDEIKAILERNDALANSKIAPYKFFLGLKEEEKTALLPFIQRNAGRTTANNLDRDTLALFKEGGYKIEIQLEEQFKAEGIDRAVTVQDVYTAAREIVSGQRQPPKGLDLAGIRG
jgi:hypothetical protein